MFTDIDISSIRMNPKYTHPNSFAGDLYGGYFSGRLDKTRGLLTDMLVLSLAWVPLPLQRGSEKEGILHY